MHLYTLTRLLVWTYSDCSELVDYTRYCLAVIISEPALELHSRAAPRVEAHHRVNNLNTGRNSGGTRIIKKTMCTFMVI